MRILVVSNIFPPIVRGGYEVECRDVVEHLRGEHEVVVLTSSLRARECPPQEGVLRHMPLVPESTLGVLRAPLAVAPAMRVMRETLAAVRPDLIWVWNAAGLPLAALRVVHDSGVPIAYRVCEHWFGGIYDGDLFLRYLTPTHRAAHPLWSAVVRTVNRLPALRLTEHPPAPAAISWNSEFLRAGVPVPRAITPVLEDIVHPVSAAADALADVPRRPAEDPPTVLFVGRIEEQKGIEVPIRALAVLERRHQIVAGLTVVGGGDPGWQRRLETLARDEGVAERVRFTGPLRGADLHAEVAAASAWVVPSVWDEPAPMVCVEAGLARVPLVASRVGGIPELLREGDEALLFARGDADGCADALAATLRGDGTPERVARGFARAQELSHEPYLRAMDRFVAEAVAAMATA